MPDVKSWGRHSDSAWKEDAVTALCLPASLPCSPRSSSCPSPCPSLDHSAAACLHAPAWITARLPISLLQPGSWRGCPSPCPSLDHRAAALAVLAIWRSVRLRGAETPRVLSQGRETSAVPLQVQKAHREAEAVPEMVKLRGPGCAADLLQWCCLRCLLGHRGHSGQRSNT